MREALSWPDWRKNCPGTVSADFWALVWTNNSCPRLPVKLVDVGVTYGSGTRVQKQTVRGGVPANEVCCPSSFALGYGRRFNLRICRRAMVRRTAVAGQGAADVRLAGTTIKAVSRHVANCWCFGSPTNAAQRKDRSFRHKIQGMTHKRSTGDVYGVIVPVPRER